MKKRQFFKGLLPARIHQFDQLQADESFVDDQCAICMEDFEIGRNMICSTAMVSTHFVKFALKDNLLNTKHALFVGIFLNNFV